MTLKTHNDHFKNRLFKTLLIRRLEERLIELYPSDKIQSPVHLSIGQEPVAVGICDAMDERDLLFTTYRGHAYFIAKGGNLKHMMAELYGRRDGMSGGKAGSMHLCAPEVGMMGSSAVVASTISHAAGAALAAQLKGQDQVCVAVFGDGATEEGVYHETLNFAALKKLPVLFVCENNTLAVHTSLAERQSYDMASHAAAYGITTHTIQNGNDFEAVAEVTAQCLKSIREGRGPVWLMVNTFRYKEHVGTGEDFNAGYRLRSEMSEWVSTDPVFKWPDLVAEFEEEVRDAIDDAVAFAEASPLPVADDLLTHVE